MARGHRSRRGGGRGNNAGRGRQTVEPASGVVRRPEKQGSRQRGAGRGRGARQPPPTGRRAKGKVVQAEKRQEEAREDFFVRHQEIPKAHEDAVMAIVMAEDAIYTASRDKILKRWRAQRGADNKFALQPDLEVPLGETCWCLLSAGEWMLCGLGDGRIRAFSKSGQETTLEGHTQRVLCLLIHQHVLLSGGADGTVKCWQATASPAAFACTHTVSEGVSSRVVCMSVLGDHLWVGGSSGLSLVLLSTLAVTGQIGPKKNVSGLLQFEGHMIVAYADGAVIIYDGSGAQKLSQPPMAAGPVLCIAGLESGPRVLCGHAKGQLSSIALPAFCRRATWQALERCKVQSLSCAGHDGIFVMGAENGALQLWQRDEVAEL